MGFFDGVRNQVEIQKNIIKNFAISCAGNWDEWPEEVNLSNEDIFGLQLLLEKNNAPAFKAHINTLFCESIAECRYIKFSESFSKYCLDASNENDYIRHYVMLFNDSDLFLSEFLKFLRSKGFKTSQLILSVSFCAIKKQIENDRLLNRIESIMSKKQQRERLLKIEEVDLLDGVEFENYIIECLQRLGFEVSATKASGDQGADIIINKSGKSCVIQAKRYSNNVGNSAIQEIVASKKIYHAGSAVVVTNSFFTRSAIELARANGVELWDRNYVVVNFCA